MPLYRKPIYCPAFRQKAGELEGVRRLSSDVADLILPRFIVPPLGERDDSMPLLFDAERIPDVSEPLARHWRNRATLVDLSFVIDEMGRNSLGLWLPLVFQRAWKRNVRAIPIAKLSDLRDDTISAFSSAIAENEHIKFAFCVSSEELVGSESHDAIKRALRGLLLDFSDCAVVVDFGGSEFGDPTIVAPVISGVLESLQELGPWQQIIFQGSSYPEVNPAKNGEVHMCPRNEWIAWCQAVNFDPNTAEHMTFGDYASDCAKMSFEKVGAPAIRHIRYATPTSWLVQRAGPNGSDASRMQQVYRALAEHHDFAGADFSDADAFIAHAARTPAARPGNSTTWRQLNITHHVTRAVADIARVRGIRVEKISAGDFHRQLLML